VPRNRPSRLAAAGLARRQEKDAEALSWLTGWDIKDVRERMDLKPLAQREWWERLWRSADHATATRCPPLLSLALS
jgi:hypothetical protein